VPAPSATLRSGVNQAESVVRTQVQAPGSGLPQVQVPVAPLPAPVSTLPPVSVPQAPVSGLPPVSVPAPPSSEPAAGSAGEVQRADLQSGSSSAPVVLRRAPMAPALAKSVEGGFRMAAQRGLERASSGIGGRHLALILARGSLVSDLVRGLDAGLPRLPVWPGSPWGSQGAASLASSAGSSVPSLVALLVTVLGLLYLPRARPGPPVPLQGPVLVSLIERPG
jgi:hypothetical protein